jgi:D-serine deaminase-like pyridoxal phosphate-dependent protein
MEISTPFVWVDLDKVEDNIAAMVARLNKAGIGHRPHIKAHKTVELAQREIELGGIGITTAKLSEAEVMAAGGIKDILVAFPLLGEERLARLKALLPQARISTIVDSRTVAEGLSRVGQELGRKVEVLIEIDGGIHRGGVLPGEPALKFAKSIADLPGIDIVGLMVYVGQIYAERTEAGIRAVAGQEAKMLLETRDLLNANGFNIRVLSGGSTASSAYADELRGLTESRAGNFIFFDANAIRFGIATEADIALKVRTMVVSTPQPGYATIDAGSKTLTSDGSITDASFGLVCGMPGVELVKLNEEHGFLRYDPAKYQLKVGDLLDVIPNHCCVLPNLCDHIYGFRGGKFTGKISVDARGKNY